MNYQKKEAEKFVKLQKKSNGFTYILQQTLLKPSNFSENNPLSLLLEKKNYYY